MKRKLGLLLLVAATVALLIRWKQPGEHRTEIVTANITPAAPESDASNVVQDISQPANPETTANIEASNTQNTPPELKPVVLPDPTAEHETFLARFDHKLTDDSDIDELIRNRLWLALDQFNNPLVKSLELTPAETEMFKSLVVDNLVSAAALAIPDIEQGPKAVEAAMNKALTDSRDNLNTKIAELLGETRFAIYETYQGDYAQFNRIKFLNGNEPLTDPQTEQVLDIILDEKEIVSSAAAQVQAADAANEQFSAIEQQNQQNAEVQKLINERVYDRLKNILSEDRLASFVEFQARPPQIVSSPSATQNR
jgi:hypothetical protein